MVFQCRCIYESCKTVVENFKTVMVKWDEKPTLCLNKTIAMFGPPDTMDSKKGGMAVWGRKTMYEKTGFLERLEIHDEPKRFLYSYYRLDIPSQLIDDVRGISNKLTYDSAKKEVRVHDNTMDANYATLVLAKKIVNGELTGYEAKNNHNEYLYATVEGHPLYDPYAVGLYKIELKQFYDTNRVDCFPVEKDLDKCRA